VIPSLKTTDQSLQLEEIDVLLIATGAGFSRNDVVQCPVNSDGSYTTCITPTAAGIGTVASAICSDGIMGVVLGSAAGFEAVAQNGTAQVRLRGRVPAVLLSTSAAAYAIDAPMFVNTSKQLEVDQAGGDANKKIVATATVAATSATSTPTAFTVMFDGIGGFGRCGGSAS
jgi:hypothetical protein